MNLFALLVSTPLCTPVPALLQEPPREATRGVSVDAEIAQGRELYERGELDQALAAFEVARAHEDSWKTRVWVLRTMLAQGSIQDVQEELALRGEPAAPELDYLLGMAVYFGAQSDVQTGRTSGVTGAQFEDAARLLLPVVESGDERFEDAWAAIAESAWYAQDLELARRAAERAVELQPQEGNMHLLRGRIAMSQYSAANSDDARKDTARSHWSEAVASFQRATETYRAQAGPYEDWYVATASFQLGNAYLWQDKLSEAKSAFVTAIELDPSTVDLDQMWASLKNADEKAAAETVEMGLARNAKKHARAIEEEPALLWWRGFAELDKKDLKVAEKTFELVLEKTPEITNTWYYIFRARVQGDDKSGAVEALRENFSRDPDGLIAAVTGDWDSNFDALLELTNWCARQDRRLDAAFVSEVCTQVAPQEPTFWNNLGLFLRDEGDRLRGTQGALRAPPRDYDEKKVAELWERSYYAYRRAFELDPENPGYLNDIAVMLHYYLVRDLNEAMRLYQKAERRAQEELARTDLEADVRRWFETAHRDAKNNQRLLASLIEDRSKSGG